MKIKVEKKDLIIFIIFCVFLLYLCAIGVLNVSSLASNSKFYGFLPFKAFTSKYIGMTLFLFIVCLVGIFLAVKSYIFDHEKGFGLSVGSKKEKGYSRWATDAEFKKGLEVVNIKDQTIPAAGIALYSKKGKMWVDNGEDHWLVMGATGSGKTQTVIFPTVELLAKHKESMIITDPKGEIYEATANMLKDKGYNILLLNFRDPQQGNAWNPLSLPYNMYKSGNQDKAIELLDDLAANILYEENSGNADPFWEKTSADYFSGLSLGMFEDAKPEEVNINTISLMTTVGEEKCGGSTYAKEYFSFKDPASPAYVNASGTIMAPNETKGSIIAVFKQKIKLFASRENLSEMLAYNDVNLEEIGEKPTALFIVIQDEKKTYHSLVTILLKQCYETLISVAQKHGGKLPVRTNFLLDEFANMPPLKDITTMITAARSRRIRFTMIIQNFAQLDQVYGKENAETIRGNCGNIIYLITTELKALEEISKMCGEVKSKKDDKTASTPLVTVSDLQRMKQFEVIILRIRMQPFKTKFTPYFKMKSKFGKSYPKATYPEREKREVKVFNIKDYVNTRRQEKLKSMMSESGMPAGGGFGAGFPGMPPMFGQQDRPMPQSRPTGGSNGGINIDDLVKKIDAKIAALEEEEKAEANKPVKDVKPVKPEKEKATSSTMDINKLEERINEKLRQPSMVEEEKPRVEPKVVKEEVKPKDEPVKKDVPTISLDEEVREDRFFDDFFDDDDE